MVDLININYKWLLSVDQAFCESYTCNIVESDKLLQMAELFVNNPDLISALLHCYMLNDSICHFSSVGSSYLLQTQLRFWEFTHVLFHV